MYMNVSVKREQSQTGLNFAERKKLRPQVKQTTRQRRGLTLCVTFNG